MNYLFVALFATLCTAGLQAQVRAAQPEPCTPASIQMHRDMATRFDKLGWRFRTAFSRKDTRSLEVLKSELLQLLDAWSTEVERMRLTIEQRVREVDGRAQPQRKQQYLQYLAGVRTQAARLEQLRGAFAAWQYSTLPQHEARSSANLAYLDELSETFEKLIGLEAQLAAPQSALRSKRDSTRVWPGQ